MLIILALLLTLLTATLLLLLRYALQQRQALQAALNEMEQLNPAPGARVTAPEMVLTIKVLNAIEVAKRESRSARIVAPHMPVTVRKMVYKQVMREVGMELSQRGIESEINVEFR
ncbi:MAG: hypothetical protein EA349_12885 [Halomonadaceae bacterium]|nr:MAG: hypothetical protein EA349_12885 [Halomonadaceae bacterium]